ncbi:uncharacterized protein A1O9_02600 [Exophiala aquamarina CBS 119918]|uniref:NAD(P)-binding domain-containing protein n=1 Tax=Exophiala aquamarina CBS 119918 TaxID=1182545 RepID=A0A072PMC9_9EURO|nr:uncharacterized protein A1O9_02600 [Exophiala aquamarina CBS 119918]KEF61036.1 hypothetical protein A1O9_02600 [Exophiala aquamarina CBS 119918]
MRRHTGMDAHPPMLACVRVYSYPLLWKEANEPDRPSPSVRIRCASRTGSASIVDGLGHIQDQPTKPIAMQGQHYLLLGATGASGVEFIQQVLEEAAQKPVPHVTLFIRSGSESKLPSAALDHANFRLVEGSLADPQAIQKALAADEKFPTATIVVSFLGAYMTLKPLFTRDKSHPIADAFTSSILPTMKASNVSRIIALSTPTGCYSAEEAKTVPWKWWFYMQMPRLFAPQGNSEMAGIANAVISVGNKDRDLEWTVFRVPHLTDGLRDAAVVAGLLDQNYTASLDLSRGSLVKWMFNEVNEKAWIRGTPMLANP